MYIYDDTYKRIKSVNDLSIGDRILFSANNSPIPFSLTKNRLNSEWIVLSKLENKKIFLRHRYSKKKTIELSSLKILDGFLKLKVDDKTTITFKLFYKKRYSLTEYFKLKYQLLINWIFSKQ